MPSVFKEDFLHTYSNTFRVYVNTDFERNFEIFELCFYFILLPNGQFMLRWGLQHENWAHLICKTYHQLAPFKVQEQENVSYTLHIKLMLIHNKLKEKVWIPLLFPFCEICWFLSGQKRRIWSNVCLKNIYYQVI